jgi:2-dehydro-3-deoxyphosphooctonate aldolase (KDO 8-P synthase)
MSPAPNFLVGPIHFVPKAPLFLIAGPCVIESEAHATTMAERIAEIAAGLGVPYIFKASYDKANRSSVNSYRGPGLQEGLRILGAIRKRTGVPVLTDIHDVSQVAPAAEVCDVLQIPAFLCRQTDLLVAAGKSGRVVNISAARIGASSSTTITWLIPRFLSVAGQPRRSLLARACSQR